MATAKGLSVPFRFTSLGYPEACIAEKCLHDSIFTILSTFPGERVMRPDFGSYLQMFLFEPMSRATGFRARAEVFRAIAAWEPRVAVLDVLFELTDTTITLHVTWRANGNLLAVTSLELPRNGA
jgi:phage baseplate assembly protein W